MNKCETDLTRSKSIREKQFKDSQKQIEKLKANHEREVREFNFYINTFIKILIFHQICQLKQEFCEKERILKIHFDEEHRQLLKQNADACAAVQDKSIENNLKYQSRIESLTSVCFILISRRNFYVKFD